jgi:O-antigen/teichoic acid export membrane protein
MKILPQLSPTAWVTAQTLITQCFGLLLFAVQAPMLGPRAFGLVGIVMAFLGVCELLVGDAAAECLISIRDINQRHYDSMNTITMLISLAMGGAIFFSAPTLSDWFGEPQLRNIFRWMALLPVITALTSVPTAVTKHDMQFRPLALRSIGSVIVAGVCGLTLTLLGAGVWALVCQALVQRSVALIVLWVAVPVPLRFGFSATHLRDIGRYAGPVALSKIMSLASASIPRIIIGLYLGAIEVGYFSMAARLCEIMMLILVVPKFAVARIELRKHISMSPELSQSVALHLRTASAMCYPVCIGAVVVAPTLFHVWLDQRWYGGILTTQLILLTCVPGVTSYCATATLMALNRQGSEALASTVMALTIALAAWIAAPFGLTAVAIGLLARSLAILPLPALLLRRCGISVRTLVSSQLAALLGALLLATALLLMRWQLVPRLGNALALMIMVIFSTLAYLAMLKRLVPASSGALPGWLAARLGRRTGKAP